MPYIIYADIESLILKIDGHASNPEKVSTTKIGSHTSCGYSMSTILGFDHREGKHTLYPRKDCLKKFPEDLRKHARSIIFFGKKKMLPLIRKELKSFVDADIYIYIYLWDKILKKYSLKYKLSKS